MTPDRAEQFDRALQALLDGRPPQQSEFDDLLDLGARLRDLPHSEFKAKLKTALERKDQMTATTTDRREGFKTLTPFIFSPTRSLP